MKTSPPSLLLTTSPFLKDRTSTAWIMWQVNLALAPLVLAAVYFFGVGALLVVAAAVAGAALPEWLVDRRKNTLADGSAVITGVLLALTLPPGIPLWMAFFGGAAGIVLGKLIFGGLGFSVFNPALVGRALLQAAFPVAMTTWAPHGGARDVLTLHGDLFALPFVQSGVDAVTAATPLAQMKFAGQETAVADLWFGATAGSLGETSAALILVCGAYLAARNLLNWRIPAAIFAAAFGLGAALHLADPSAYAPPLFHLFAGGLMLGAVFMATDPVTSPLTQRGCWLFGAGIGILVVVIRTFGGLPEGVMYAILLMNAVSPLLSRATQPRVFGTKRAAAKTP